MINISEALIAMKKAGSTKVRMVPDPGQSIQGTHRIEIYENSSWNAIIVGLPRTTASDLINQASNKVLLG